MVEDVKIKKKVCQRDKGDLSVLPDYLILVIDKVHESIIVQEKQLADILKEYQSTILYLSFWIWKRLR